MAKVMSFAANALELAQVFSDYRTEDGLDPLDTDNVLEWVEQFDVTTDEKSAFLKELTHIYKQTYYSQERVRAALKDLASDTNFTGPRPAEFWAELDVLDIQRKGTSQSDLREVLAEQVEELFGVTIKQHELDDRHSLYLDDAIFSGNRVVNDVETWLEDSESPRKLSILVLDAASGGEWSIGKRLNENLSLAPKFWRFTQTNNRSDAGGRADVLRLENIPLMRPVWNIKNSISAENHRNS